MLLKDTTEGKEWLRQFDVGDQADATFLLDSLRLVSDNRFHGDMRRAVGKAAEGLGDDIALFAVREVGKDEKYFETKAKRPTAVRQGKVGSEGTMSRIITGLERGKPQRFMNHPPLRSMKERETRHAMLLDDLVGTGDRVVDFVRSIRRHKTIVSWCSSHHLQFHVVAYAISQQAEGLIRRTFGKRRGDWPRVNVSFTFAKRPGVIEGQWSDAELQRMKNLCNKYARRAKIPWGYELGYRKSLSTLVFAHSCPNNVPGILWSSTKTWSALFPNRDIPEGLLESTFSKSDAQELQPAVTASRVAAGFEQGDPVGADVIRLLELLSRRIRGRDRLADILGESTLYCDKLLTACTRYKLVNSDNILTDSGRAELQRAQRAAKLRQEQANGPKPFYVPKQLREARGNV